MSTIPSVTVTDFDIGPCRVKYGSTDIGGTAGNVTIKFKYVKKDMHADQYGSTLLDAAIAGMECMIDTEFLETRDKTVFALIFPSSAVTGSTHKYIDFKDKTAVRQLALANTLELHPLVEDSTSKDQDWYFYKAIPWEDSQYVFGPAEQAKLKISWHVVLDTSPTPALPARMFRVGDQSL